MAEVILRLRVLDHAMPVKDNFDTRWQRLIDVEFVPALGDEIQLWGREDGVLSPVRRRWWRTDGTPLLELAEMSVDISVRAIPPSDPDLGLRWVPWFSDKGDPAELLRGAGWEVLPYD